MLLFLRYTGGPGGQGSNVVDNAFDIFIIPKITAILIPCQKTP
jgi:hypothetical protein